MGMMAFMLDITFEADLIMATGGECHGPKFGLLRKITWTNKSTKTVLSSK